MDCLGASEEPEFLTGLPPTGYAMLSRLDDFGKRIELFSSPVFTGFPQTRRPPADFSLTSKLGLVMDSMHTWSAVFEK